MNKRRRRFRHVRTVAVIGFLPGALCAPTGCVTESRPLTTAETLNLDDPSTFLTKEGVKNARSGSVQSVVLPMGMVPWDAVTLPLISPDGRTVATHVGVAPSMPTVLASRDAEPPAATFIELYRVTAAPTGSLDAEPVSLGRVKEPVVLGRSVDDAGFLVESPREDGSRWIGKASWSTGEVTWLVRDDAVNAFAVLGTNGRLAYSKRSVDEEHFRLVVREPTGQEWTYGNPGEDWIMPVWSGRNEGLFVLRRMDGALRLVFGIGITRPAFRQSYREFPLIGSSVSRRTAYRMLENNVNIADEPGSAMPTLTFVHPTESAMAMWRPMAFEQDRILLHRDSFAAMPFQKTFALVSLEDRLVRANLEDRDRDVTVSRTLSILRPVSTPDWPFETGELDRPGMTRVSTPFMMLTPEPEGVTLTAIYLITG